MQIRVLGVLTVLALSGAGGWSQDLTLVDDFDRPDTLYHGHHWETLNPGYWKIQDSALRRRLENIGNKNPITNFPFHWSNGGKEAELHARDALPNLPMGMIWQRDWKLSGNYTVRATFTVRNLSPEGRGEQDGYMGVCFGGESLYESRSFRGPKPGAGSWMALWHKDGAFGLFDHSMAGKTLTDETILDGPTIGAGDEAQIEVQVSGGEKATVTARIHHGGTVRTVSVQDVDRAMYTDGYLGLACYGSLDFEVNRVEIVPGDNEPTPLRLNDLHVCYPLGDTLKLVDGEWTCKFVALFRSEGERVEVRVTDSPEPRGGWERVPVAGSAPIVDNDWRRYTALIDVAMPASPAEKTLYYTVWKDGVDLTGDPRPAEPEHGYLGPKTYVGRLPQLKAPYRVCTLGGHALHDGGTTLPRAGTYQENWIHGQPTEDSYRYFEDYDFQVVNWEDDVWYLELLFPPPSTDDAYKVITLSIANPTSRWQMMRHWNIINPGDHDYGMDDVKGPEQILVRKFDDLGQDSEYMRRNFDINHHLVQGLEEPIGTANPKNWRRWKMPNGDFSILVLESRLWRSSQDTNIWVQGGWGHKRSLYDRRDPTRALLGEEQFAWLQEIIRTDTSPLILLTGINCMHPIFTGQLADPETGLKFAQEDRVAADYAAWSAAGVDRILEVLGGRPGILSVYGDIHLACVVENKTHRVIESSCGPIGRGGSRGLKEDWAPEMTDYDGREVRVHALYHSKYGTPDLQPREGPPHWNFLEKQFDPRGDDPALTLKIRNIIDPPSAQPRGGGEIDRAASTMGRPPSCSLPKLKTLRDADVTFQTMDGRPIRGARSLPSGAVPVKTLIDIAPGTKILMAATDGRKADSRVVTTLPLP
jgi:hypothetical protein